jgi:hypothetical protein
VIGVVAVAALTSVLFFGIQLATAGSDNGSTPSAGATAPAGAKPYAVTVSPSAKLQTVGTIIESAGPGAPTTPVGAGFQAIDSPVSLKCQSGKGCHFEAVQNVQVISSTANNRFALCTVVDGSFMSEPNCPYLDVLQNDGFFHSGSFVQSQSGIVKGFHTLQTFIYSDNGISIANWEIDYRAYSP